MILIKGLQRYQKSKLEVKKNICQFSWPWAHTLWTGIIVPCTFINSCAFSRPYAPYSRPYKVENAYFKHRKCKKSIIFLQKPSWYRCFLLLSQIIYEFVVKSFHQYGYSRPYIYCFLKIFPPVRLFQTVRLFKTLEYVILPIQPYG